MENQLESVIGISKKTADRMRTAGIYSIEELASMNVEELVKLKGINIKTAVKYIEIAKKILEDKEEVEKINYSMVKGISGKEISEIEEENEEVSIGYISDFFSDEVIQRIRFLHYKIKQLEEAINRVNEEISLDDLNLISEYIDILNINYKFQNHQKA
jgi:nucleotidyltransferase/DNA polymerase involved in DNA repair